MQALPVVKIAADDIRAYSPQSVGFRRRRIACENADLPIAPQQCGCGSGARLTCPAGNQYTLP